MATAQDSISAAYRELNITALGTPPSTAQLAEGLDQLNRFLRIIFGTKMGELLQDWEAPFAQRTAPIAANYPQNPYPLGQDGQLMGVPLSGSAGTNIWPYPPGNSRIVFGNTANATVYFPEQPNDGARMGLIQGALATTGVVLTLDGNSRTINGAKTATFTVPFASGRWIYRADLGDWRPVANLALTDLLPFADDLDDYINLGLSIRLAPKNDKTVSVETATAFKAAESAFEAHYKQAGTTTFGSSNIPLGAESFLSGRDWF